MGRIDILRAVQAMNKLASKQKFPSPKNCLCKVWLRMAPSAKGLGKKLEKKGPKCFQTMYFIYLHLK